MMTLPALSRPAPSFYNRNNTNKQPASQTTKQILFRCSFVLEEDGRKEVRNNTAQSCYVYIFMLVLRLSGPHYRGQYNYTNKNKNKQ